MSTDQTRVFIIFIDMLSARIHSRSVYTILVLALSKVLEFVFLNVRYKYIPLTWVRAAARNSPTCFGAKYKTFNMAPQIVTAKHALFQRHLPTIFFNDGVPKF